MDVDAQEERQDGDDDQTAAARAEWLLACLYLDNAALVLVAMWALAVDREPVILALLVPLENFLYRQFLYFMALKAVVRALRGVRIGWNPVARLGTSSIGGESLGSDR